MNDTIKVPTADWEAGQKYPHEQWELVQFHDYYMGSPKFAEIRKK